MRAPARARRRGPALAPPPPSCGPAGAPLGAARAAGRVWHLSLVLEGRRALSARAWVGGDLRACALVCGGKGGGALGLAQVPPSPARAVTGGGRRGEARQWRGSPWTRFRENHSSASVASVRLLRRGWVEPALGLRRGFCSLPFCPVYKSAVRYIEREGGGEAHEVSLLVMTYPVVLAETQARAGRKALRQSEN